MGKLVLEYGKMILRWQLTVYSHGGNVVFPLWEHHIPTVGTSGLRLRKVEGIQGYIYCHYCHHIVTT